MEQYWKFSQVFLVKEICVRKSLKFYLAQPGNFIISTACLLKSIVRKVVKMALTFWRQTKIIVDLLSQFLCVSQKRTFEICSQMIIMTECLFITH